jgi:thiamine pyrophosphate-dependent acetolactate synthase large subunit-like protein
MSRLWRGTAFPAHAQPAGREIGLPGRRFRPVAAAFGFEARTIRTLEDLQAAAPLRRSPQGPVFMDCTPSADVAAPFMSEFYAFEHNPPTGPVSRALGASRP